MNPQVCVPFRLLNNRVGSSGLGPRLNEPFLEAVNELKDKGRWLTNFDKSEFNSATENVDPQTRDEIWTGLIENHKCSPVQNLLINIESFFKN